MNPFNGGSPSTRLFLIPFPPSPVNLVLSCLAATGP